MRVWSVEERKRLGAFYTEAAVAQFLVRWGMQRAPGVVMDPSCGDGRFLALALENGADSVVGCDVDSKALVATREGLEGRLHRSRLLETDFFHLDPSQWAPVDLVVGNPPFIRYQRFKGESRRLALASALRIGARLTRLTASWAPFLLHATQFLRSGGALAMVVPAEIVQTDYGITTLKSLCSHFESVRLLTFARNLFPGAQEETMLLLASGRGGGASAVAMVPLETHDDLAAVDGDSPHPGLTELAVAGSGPIQFAAVFLDNGQRSAWDHCLDASGAVELASLGTVANGYVSGANGFFHRTAAEAEASGYPAAWLMPTARNARSLRGLAFADADIVAHEASGRSHHLLAPPFDDLFNSDRGALRRLVEEGERLGVHGRFKCRTRDPWWRVPGLLPADVLLPYMIGSSPLASANQANAIYTNALHGLRLGNRGLAKRIAFGMLTSFTLLSMELEGRSYGGGLLKLEPSEMKRVRVVLPTADSGVFGDQFGQVDALLRAGRFDAAVEYVDEAILRRQLNLPRTCIGRLQSARERLVQRRLERSKRKRV